MSNDPFKGLVALQEDMLRFERRQLDLVSQAVKAGKTFVDLQKAGQKAAETGANTWVKWVELWTPKR